MNTPADLESAAIGAKRTHRLRFRLFVIWAGFRIEQDNMPAFKPFLLIQFSIVRCVRCRHKVFYSLVILICKRTAHNLLDLPVVQVDTWSKFH